MPECRRKVSLALAFLPVVNCLSPASGFSPVPLVTDYSGISQLWLLLTPVRIEANMPSFFEQSKTLEDLNFVPMHSLQDLASPSKTVKNWGQILHYNFICKIQSKTILPFLLSIPVLFYIASSTL
jgi:hypothetical protein